MIVTLSSFYSVTDNAPEMTVTTWDELVSVLRECSSLTAVADKATKMSTPCISPAQYLPGASRSVLSVTGWDWAAVDLDDKTGRGWRVDEARDYLAGQNIAHVIYTTTSSTPEAQSMRALFPLSRTVEPEEFKSFWYALNQFFGATVDGQTKDISRLFVAPRRWIDADNHFTSGGTLPVDPDKLMEDYPLPVDQLPPPGPVVQQMMEATADRCHKALPAAWTWDLENSPIVPAAALARATSAQQGGRMMKFLSSVAMSGISRGYAIDVHHLVDAGRSLAMRIGRRDLTDLEHDATSALKFAERTCAEALAERFMKNAKNRP